MKKRVLALLVAGVMSVASLTGCGSKISDTEVVATRGDGIEVNAKLYNFFARYMQAQYETYYKGYVGEDMWAQEAEEGKTYEQAVKDSMLENVETLLLLEQHMADYDVTITDAEKQVIADMAAKFIEDNEAEDLKIVDADQAVAERALTLVAIQNKMVEAIGKDADPNVSDAEALQKKIQYVSFSLKSTDDEGNSVDMTDEEKADLEKEIEEFLAGAKEADDLEAYAKEQDRNAITKSFGEGDTAPTEEVLAAADKLKDGEFSGIIKTENAYYIVKMLSTFDEEATDTKKESIVSQRKSQLYTDKVTEWFGDTESKINDKVYEKISFLNPIVSMKAAETEEAAE